MAKKKIKYFTRKMKPWKKALLWTAGILGFVGSANWFLFGALKRFDLVDYLFGNITWLSSTVYTLAGLGGMVMIGIGLYMLLKTK